MTFNPKELVAKVIDYTIKNPYERDYWEKAPALTGILVWEFGEPIAAIQRWMDRAVETQTTEGCLNYSERLELPAGHVSTFTPTASLSASLGYPLLDSTSAPRTSGTWKRRNCRPRPCSQLPEQVKAAFAHAPKPPNSGSTSFI
ncbi:MAG: hypothetical protein NVV83_23530 [Afipia sp.]|nr:hypothetical protein [Afipia sp.]